jgi:hypothetical protein
VADTPSVLIVKDGQAPQTQQNIGVMVDSSGTKYHQEYIRFDGGVAGAANPFPVTDAAAETALTSAVALLTTIAGSSGGGGSTAALQTTGNTTLGSILTALGSTATTALQTAGNALLTAISGALTTANGYLSAIATAEAAGNTSLATLAGAVSGGKVQVNDAQSVAFQGVVTMTVGTTYASARSVGVNCTAGGNVQLTLADTSTITLPASVGWQTYPFAATQIVSAGTTAAGTFYNLV